LPQYQLTQAEPILAVGITIGLMVPIIIIILELLVQAHILIPTQEIAPVLMTGLLMGVYVEREVLGVGQVEQVQYAMRTPQVQVQIDSDSLTLIHIGKKLEAIYMALME
jgi:hypothetical protein